MAEYMLRALKEDEKHWRNKYRKDRHSFLASVFTEDWKKGGPKHYNAIKKAGTPKVDSINVVSNHRILTRRSRQKGQQHCTLLDDDLHLVTIGAIWRQGKAEAQVQDIHNGHIVLRNTKGCFISGKISQFRPTAQPQQILHEAQTYWDHYWNPIQHCQAQDPLVQQAVSSLPQLQEMQLLITEQDLEWALSALPLKKARGMDGFSNFEMKNLPKTLRPYLLALFHLFNQGKWPQNLTKARMALLYKTEQTGDMATTRPITILATTYRIWAKIITRKMLNHIRNSLPRTLFGSVPGRSASDMVSIVQSQLEQALLKDAPLAGISLDFSKAYNTLPRRILQQINKRLGLTNVWKAYAPFLEGLQRYFTCGKDWGSPVKSTTGVPEGCPIAVVQMIVLTWTFTSFIMQRTQVPLYTYVDDWILLSKDLPHLKDAMQLMETLARRFGLLLSTNKSAVFATTSKLTKQLHGLMVQSGIDMGSTRNFAGLGVNFQTAKIASTEVRNKRWDNARTQLDKLQYMPWSHQRKTDIIVRAILPLIFYGVENCCTGKDFLREVRAKCNHAVWGKQQYHLHFLTPLFSGTIYEPMLYTARRRFASFLRSVTLEPQLVKDNWRLSITQYSFFKKRTKGPISILQNQLHELGWQLHADGKCTTPAGRVFYIWDVSATQFGDVVRDSWEDVLLQQLNQKVNLADITSFSIDRTLAVTHPDPMKQGFMRKVRLGGLFPNHRKIHVTKEEDTCHFCGCLDTMEHRVFACPGTEHVRQMDGWTMVAHQPRFQVLGGLSPKLPLIETYKSELDALPLPTAVSIDSNEGYTEFFTDGSAEDSSCPITRLCSWSVTQADYLKHGNKLVTSGILPGRQQTVFRAELFAVLVVLAIGVKSRIYCDNSAVVRNIHHLQHYGYQPLKWASHPDRDLIKTAASLLATRATDEVKLIWVKAHRQFHEACNAYDLWCIHHNSIADECARKAFVLCPPHLKHCKEQLKAELKRDLLHKTSAAEILRMVMDEF